MLLEQLLAKLKTALEARTTWDVYWSDDATPFEKRAGQFLVLGMKALEIEEPFLTSTMVCYGFTAKPQVTMLLPAETDDGTAYATFYREVMSGMLSSGCGMARIQSGVPEQLRQFRRMALSATFEMRGIYQMSREEVGV